MAAPMDRPGSLELALRTLSTAAFAGTIAVGLTGRVVLAIVLGVVTIVLGLASALVTRSRAQPPGRTDKR